MEIQTALSTFTWPNSLVQRTQFQDRNGDAFYAKTYDNKTIILQPYRRGIQDWFVLFVPGVAGYTTDVMAAFDVFNNVSVYTLKELLDLINKA